jgi:membrane protease YdiL (CAAX protease family)
VVSSLTFGVGHIVNLLLGAPLLDTLLQLMYASAIGVCYTAVFCVSGSILPCVVSHVFVNSTSIFAQELSNRENILIAVAQTILSIGYGIWLLRKGGKENGEYTSAGGVWRGADAE